MNEKKIQIEYPGPEKTGAFIKFLRISHNFTQEELGDMVYVTRKAVSKWENGICYPSIDLIPRIADLFGVSLEEILAGEFKIEEDNLNTFDYVIKVFKNKHIKNILTSIIVICVFCLLIFFFENYNATKIYDIYYEDDNIYVKNGIIISTRSKQYINFGTVRFEDSNLPTDTLIKYQLYMINSNNKSEILASYSMKNNPYYSNVDYKELTNVDLNNHLNDLMLNIKYINNNIEINKNVKLLVKLRYKSNDVYQIKEYKESFLNALTPNSEMKNANSKGIYVNKSEVNISYFLNLPEVERIKRYNKKTNSLMLRYANNCFLIYDNEYELTIDLMSHTYYIRKIKIIDNKMFSRNIENGVLQFDSFLNNKTANFINKVINFFTEDKQDLR